MRAIIIFLIVVMGLLIANLIAYGVSDDYKFFLKKLKYPDEVVYVEQPEVSDKDTLTIIDTTPDKLIDTNRIQPSDDELTFLEAISGDSILAQKDELPELSESEQNFLDQFVTYEFIEVQNPSSLFDVTTEYPDPYYDFYTPDLSIFVFSTKSYSEVLGIFKVLSHDLPFTLKELNNFGQASAYINLDTLYSDDYVRIILEYENKAFGLKIQKDLYNEVKPILLQL